VAVEIEGERVDGDLVTQIGREQFAGFGIPQLERAIVAAGRQLLAVGLVSRRPDIAVVGFPRID